MERNLDEIAKRCGTDKASQHKKKSHGYTVFYEKYFEVIRNEDLSLLEIGIYKGSSLKMWNEYFKNANIYGIDIASYNFDNPKIKTFVADQSNRKELLNVCNVIGAKFDIIIDDGGHKMDQQQISLACLLPFVKSGGFYVIEDLETSGSKKYNPTETKNTTHAILKLLSQNKKFQSEFIDEKEIDYVYDNTEYCNIENAKVSPICFIKKK